MRAEVIAINTLSTPKKRECWTFDISYDGGCIYFESYIEQTKVKNQKIWHAVNHWQRLDKRNNNIENPPLPEWVTQNAILQFQKKISELPIKY